MLPDITYIEYIAYPDVTVQVVAPSLCPSTPSV